MLTDLAPGSAPMRSITFGPSVQMTSKGKRREFVGSHVRWLNGKKVIMIGGGAGQYELATVDPFSMKRKRVLTTTDHYRYFQVSPDRNMIAYWQPTARGHDLLVHELDTETIITIASWNHQRPDIHPAAPSWHASSNRVIVGIDGEMLVLEVPF